jgi:hypothetical protein
MADDLDAERERLKHDWLTWSAGTEALHGALVRRGRWLWPE